MGAFDPLFVERQLSASDSALNYHYNLNVNHRRILPLYARQYLSLPSPKCINRNTSANMPLELPGLKVSLRLGGDEQKEIPVFKPETINSGLVTGFVPSEAGQVCFTCYLDLHPRLTCALAVVRGLVR